MSSPIQTEIVAKISSRLIAPSRFLSQLWMMNSTSPSVTSTSRTFSDGVLPVMFFHLAFNERSERMPLSLARWRLWSLKVRATASSVPSSPLTTRVPSTTARRKPLISGGSTSSLPLLS